MAMLRRIAGGIVFVIAVITFLLCATGTVGAWVARATLDEATLLLIESLTDYLDLAIDTMETLDGRVAQAQQTVQTLQQDLAVAARPDLSDRPVVQRAQQVVSEQIQPTLEQLFQRIQRLRTSIENLNRQIERLNRLPFTDLPTLPNVLAVLDPMLGQIEAAQRQAQQLRSALELRDRDLLQTASTQLEASLNQVSTSLTEGQNRIALINAGLKDFNQMMTFWTTVSTTAISGLLIIFAVGQISLAVHAWGWMRGQPVVRRRR